MITWLRRRLRGHCGVCGRRSSACRRNRYVAKRLAAGGNIVVHQPGHGWRGWSDEDELAMLAALTDDQTGVSTGVPGGYDAPQPDRKEPTMGDPQEPEAPAPEPQPDGGDGGK